MDNKYDENDYCDLDPGKICDNCCKCIDKDGEEYRTVLAEFEDQLAMTDSVIDIEDDIEDDAPLEFDGRDIPLPDIDPALLAEWEEKLRAAEEAENKKHTASATGLRGRRPRRS